MKIVPCMLYQIYINDYIKTKEGLAIGVQAKDKIGVDVGNSIDSVLGLE